MVMEQYLSEITPQNGYNRDGNEIPLKLKPVIKREDINSPSESMDCSICLELVQDPVVTFCGHLYCWPCIYKWIHIQSEPSVDSDIQSPPQCPVCKAEISEETVIPLYGKGLATEPSKAPHLGLDIPQRPQSPRYDNNSPRSSLSTPTSTVFGSRVPQLSHLSRVEQPQPSHDGFASRIPQLSHLSRVEQPQPSQDGFASRVPQLSNLSRVEQPPQPPSNDGIVASTNLSNPAMAMLGEMVYGRIFGNSHATVYAYPNSYNVAGNDNPRIRRHMMESDKSLSRLTFFLFCCMLLCLLFF